VTSAITDAFAVSALQVIWNGDDGRVNKYLSKYFVTRDENPMIHDCGLMSDEAYVIGK
jgi:hypothetical protein